MNTTPFGVKISRIMREIHAISKYHNADSLAKSTGIAGARGWSMKTTILNLIAAILFVAGPLQLHAQGTLIDQESASGPVQVEGNGNVDGLNIQEDDPLMQSFVPTLSAIDFVSLEFWDIPGNGTAGATVEVNLYTGSPDIGSATLLGTTASVYMPNGFNNSGLGIAGIATFDFSSPVALIAGNTYYLEPVVVSGDNPWDIITIGDTYANGRLYGSTGGYFQPATDFWFQEGIEAVPEPGTFALIAFVCLSAFIFRRHLKQPKLQVILFACSVLAFSVSAVKADSVVQATADAANLTPVSTVNISGTFWVASVNPNGGLTTLPYPILPTNMMDLPTYLITNSIYLVDDTGGQISPSSERLSSVEASSVVSAESETVESLIEMEDAPPAPTTNGIPEGTNFPPFMLNALPPIADTTNIWLLGTNEASEIGFILENTTGGNYQLLSTTNLLNTNWDLGQILQGAYAGYDNNIFNAVPYTNAMMFFRVHQANPIMVIEDGADSVELDTTNNTGSAGYIYVYDEGSQTNDITVNYSISGTARNGIDYSNLTGSVVVPASSYNVQIPIDPTDDGLKPNQTVILNLMQNTNYLIAPAYYSATNNLQANPQVYPIASGDNEPVCPNTPLDFTLPAQDPRDLTLSDYTIVTWPAHGILLITNGLPNVTYIPTNCYEGYDTFTYTVSDGQYTSTPATVILNIGNTVYANAASAQTCRDTPVMISLTGGDYSCGIATNFAVFTNPSHGTAIIDAGNSVTYTPTNTDFTGTDTWAFVVYDECGDSATNTVTVAVGDVTLFANSQDVTTGTNRPVPITLSGNDYGHCTGNTNYNNYFTYAIVNGPTNGTLTNTSGAKYVYTPNTNYEGMDSFQFTASDGAISNGTIGSATIYVVAGPILTTGCGSLLGAAAELTWSLDTNVLNMSQHEQLNIRDFVIYRSTNLDGTYTPIFTNTDTSEMYYFDTSNTNMGEVYYYAVNFESDESGTVYESPLSNKIGASAQNTNNLISATAIWQVVTNLADTNDITNLKAPLSNYYPSQYPGIYPLPNSFWAVGTTDLVSTTMLIPTNTDLSQVQYSIAIDNDYYLYVNGTYVTYFHHEDEPTWAPYQSFSSGLLHYGTNTINLEIIDEGIENYFSMVVTTNTCD